MNYAGTVIRNQRIKRNWSQEGLCRGICAVSYLSKIEQGKTEPSEQVLALLMERLGICWRAGDETAEQWILDRTEELLSYHKDFYGKLRSADREKFLFSPWGLDFQLLEQFSVDGGMPLPEEFECCMDKKQLALQRLLQGRYEEALGLYPVAFVYSAAGTDCYESGQTVQALELLQTGYDLAAREGRPRVMLHCKATMGNCYSNRGDVAAMQAHYRVARRLAITLEDDIYRNAIDYNIAATCLETGDYEKALDYFARLEQPEKLALHKVAICYEKLGRKDAALGALEQAKTAAARAWIPEDLENRMLELVRLRLEDPGYLKNEEYGRKLTACFEDCRRLLPAGYAGFHLPWMLEWLEKSRQYKKALALLRDFPQK